MNARSLLARGLTASGETAHADRDGLRRVVALSGAALVIGMMVPASRAMLEATMTRHMLVQLPLMLVAGSAMACGIPASVRARVAPFNAGGAAGMLLALLLSACVMVPRVLDAAVASVSADLMKGLCLIIAGAALQLSWQAAGQLGQAFAVGNACWMLGAVGLMLREAPTRICASYLEGDQQRAGLGLVLVAALTGGTWLWGIRREWWLVMPKAQAPENAARGEGALLG